MVGMARPKKRKVEAAQLTAQDGADAEGGTGAASAQQQALLDGSNSGSSQGAPRWSVCADSGAAAEV